MVAEVVEVVNEFFVDVFPEEFFEMRAEHAIDNLVSRYKMVYMARKKTQKEKEGYTLAEMRVLTDRMIDESMDRLRKRLRG